MLAHRRLPTRRTRTRLEAVAVAAVTMAVAGCSSGSEAIPVPAVDEVVTAPVASIDVTIVTETTVVVVEIPTTAAPEPVVNESTPETAPTTTPTTTTTSTTTATTDASAAPVTDARDDAFLRIGDEGDDVGLMQFKLSVLEYLPVGSDTGVFDEATEIGLRRFQSDYGLGVDGVFGPITRRALNAALQSVDVGS